MLLTRCLRVALAAGLCLHLQVGSPAARQTDAGRTLQVVTQESLATAIEEARTSLRTLPGSSFTIRIPTGTFDVTGLPGRGQAQDASIDVSRVHACPGTLTIKGEGPDRTTLITHQELNGVVGRNADCVTIADLTFTKPRVKTTQGRVVSATPDALVLEIPKGFPRPSEILPTKREYGPNGSEVVRRWLRRYVETPEGSQIDESQPQVAWSEAAPDPQNPDRWRFSLVARRGVRFAAGDLIGVKSKHGGEAYRFNGGSRITFRNIRWTLETRGVFRKVDNVTIDQCSILRPPPINGVGFLMASSSGGPQIGQPADPTVTVGHVADGNHFEATGDDSFMFAHAAGVARNNRLVDSFARGMLIYDSPNFQVGEDNVTLRAPIVRAGSR